MSISAQWAVVPAPEPSSRPASVDRARAHKINTALAHPFVRAQSDFDSVSGDAEILKQVAEVLGTPLGSLPWRTDFGSDLERLRNQNNTPILRETARVFTDDAIRKWVPSAQLVSVSIEEPNPNVVDLRVIVQIGNKQQSLTQRLRG